MPTTITLLLDNHAQTGLKQEHGLAILITHQGQKILFDNGQSSDALFANATRLNITLTDLDIIVLSHGHYDHGGNLATLLHSNPNAMFYAHPDCLQTRYSLHPNKAPRTISLSKEALAAIAAFPQQQKKFITATTEISPGAWLTGQIPRICPVEDPGGPFFLDPEKKQADLLNDDMSLWLETAHGITVVCGCCHSGIINTLDHINKQLPSAMAINTLLGGLHLVNANQTRLDATIDYLNKHHIAQIYPAHCTGDNAMSQLHQHCQNIHNAKAGLTLTL